MTKKNLQSGPQPGKKSSPALVIVLVVIALFAGVFLAKVLTDRSATATGPGGTAVTAGAQTGATTITTVHNDAIADYDAALKAGKPVYVLFHSLTCDPCIEISAVADKVIPGYADKVTFVNAITDDPSGQQLAARFQFQYIPTSFFMDASGKVVDSFTGAMDEAQMRGYLDTLVGR